MQASSVIPRSLVPDSIVFTSVEQRLDLTVTANTANVKWIGFVNNGYYYQDGAAGAVTTNNWTGDYWVAVVEKSFPYYAKAEVLEL